MGGKAVEVVLSDDERGFLDAHDSSDKTSKTRPGTPGGGSA